jgi:hypothetical protein
VLPLFRFIRVPFGSLYEAQPDPGYHEVLSQPLLITDHKETIVIAPLKVTLLFNPAYHVPPCPPLSEVVVNLRTIECFPSKVTNIIHNLVHMPLSEAVSISNPTFNELDQPI